MKNKKIWLSICAVAVVVLGIWLLSGGKKEKKVEFETMKVERQNIHTSITATGTIEKIPTFSSANSNSFKGFLQGTSSNSFGRPWYAVFSRYVPKAVTSPGNTKPAVVFIHPNLDTMIY